jgi:DNA polymerase-3 subunit delta'
MSVWSPVIGQDHAVADLQRAASDAAKTVLGERGDAMTHAWLFTGPPGSGRSVAALAFAASLVCAQGGCGACADCRDVASGLHPDVEHVVPEAVVYTTTDTDALVERAAMAPRRSPWHVIVIEDFDRFQLNAVPKLLKAIEEPPARTVWILCAPTVEDVTETIASRCRHVLLNTPSVAGITDLLMQRFGVDRELAEFAARAAQGHIGRARALATDAQVRDRRRAVLEIPSRLNQVSSCFQAAADILETISADVDAVAIPLEQADEANVRAMFGDGAEGFKSIERSIKRELKGLESRAKVRRRRLTFDEYDRVLLDLTGYYRDVLVRQLGSDAPLINEDFTASIDRSAAAKDGVMGTMKRIEALREAGDQFVANVAPQMVLESLFVTLRDSSLAAVN